MSFTIVSRRGLLRLSGLALVAGVASCTTTPKMSSTPSDGQDETAAALPLVNQLRAKNGLPPLSIESTGNWAVAKPTALRRASPILDWARPIRLK